MGDRNGLATADEIQEARKLRAAAEQSFPELLIDSLPCTFVVIDSKLGLVRWNRNFQTVSEYADQELASMSILDVIVDAHRTDVANALLQALDGRPVRMNLPGRTRSGRVVPVFVTCQCATIGGSICLVGTGWDATQHRLTELKLTDDPNVLSTLIDNLPDAVYIKDRQSRFVLCNSEVLRRKGVESLSEIVGRSDFDFYPADLAQSVYADEQDLMETGRPIVNLERCVVDRVTGQPTWNLTTKVPLRNAANETVGLVGIGRDITERKQAEEAYHAIVDHSLQGLVVIQNMKVVFANRAMAKISGFTIDEMLSGTGELLRGFVHPLDQEMVWRNHQARLDGAPLPDQYEFRVIRKDGSVRWIEIMTSRIDYQGRPAVQAACIDVTERHRAQEALRRSEARNMALLNANPDLMFRLTRGGMFLDCKPSKDDAVSVSPAQFVGRHLDEVFPASTARILMQSIQTAIDTGQVQTLEYSLPRTEHESSDFECRLVACAEQEVVAIVRDISDRRRAEHLAKLQGDMAIRLSSLSDLKEGLQYCLEAAIKTSHMDSGGIYMLDEHTGGLNLQAHVGLSEEFVAEASTYPANSRNTQLILAGEPAYATFDRLGVPVGPAQKAEGLQAVGVIPIRHENRVVACLNVGSHALAEVPPWSRVVLETLAAHIGSAISRLKVQDALQRAEREKAIILNAMGQIVTYHDTSHRIRWANQVALDAMKMTADEVVGRRCYDAWEQAAMPCKGCPVDLALRTGCAQETEIVGYNGGTWLVRGEPVRDDRGRMLGVVELAIDITRRKRDEEELKRRLQFEGIITTISTDLANLPMDQIQEGIERALSEIGSFFHADRSFAHLFRDGGTRIGKVCEWDAEGIDRVVGQVRDMDGKGLLLGLESLRSDGVLHIPSVRRFQGIEAAAREFLESISVESLLCVPIAIGGELLGLLGVSAVREERVWPEDAVPLLKIAAEIVANALERRRAQDVLRERLAFETLLSELSATFINLPAGQIDGEIERWLARIGEHLGVDRGTITQFFASTKIVTHSWAVSGIAAVSPSSTGLDFEWIQTRLREDGVFACARVEEIPAADRRAREYCELEGIKSIIIMPLKVAGSMLGCVSFSSLRTSRCWSDELVQRLRLVGQVFANAMLRRRAEEALRASETRLRSIVRAVPAGIGLLLDRVMLEVNDRFGEMTGYRREELVNTNTRRFYPTQEEYERVGLIYEGIYSRGFGVIETRWRRKDGGAIDVLLHGTPLDLTDRSKGIIFAALDVTERKRAEQALLESERQLRTLMANLPGIAYRCVNEPGWPFEFVSEGSLALTGHAPDEITGSGGVIYGSLIHPDDQRRVWETVQDAVRQNASFEMEYRIRMKSGTERWVFERGRAVPSSHAESPLLEGFIMDITERKRAEAALRESEQNYREIFNASNDAIFIHDAVTGDILDVNKTALELFGYVPGEIPRLNSEAAGTGEQPYTRQDAVKWIHKTAKEGPQLFEWLTETRDGDLHWEEVSLRPAVLGGHRRVLAVARDITDRKRAETQAQEHLAELTRAWHANTLGEMASGLAHELNQPLCAIVNYSNGCLRLFRRKDYPMETVRDSIERIAIQAQRAADIIKRIRSLVAKRDPQRSQVDLEAVLAETIQMLRDEALKHNVAIISRLETGLPTVRGDSVEIGQVVLNLMRNAIEAMSDGRIVHRNLTISSRLSNPAEVEVAVTDTGRGIPPELSEKIFDSFFTTKTQGLGIGLSLSTRIIEAHGGRLWVESDGRSGALFRFTLPVEGAIHGER